MSPRRGFSRSAAKAKPSRSASASTGTSGLFQRPTVNPAAERDFGAKEFGAIEGGKQTPEKLGGYLLKM